MIVLAHRFIAIIAVVGVAVSLLLLVLGGNLKLQGLIMA
jgi:hypothetical protein